MIDKEKYIEAWKQESDKRHGYVNPALAYSEGVSDYRSRLREEIEKRIFEFENDEDEEMSDEEITFGYQECKRFLQLIDTLTP